MAATKIRTTPHPMQSDQPSIIWHSPDGDVIACVEKNKVLQENLVEIRQICQDALDDAVLMGCDAEQLRAVLVEMVRQLEAAFPPDA
jgi:hypothetical protein